MSVETRRSGAVAYVTLNSPPVNAIGLAVRQGLEAALDWLEREDGLTRVILAGEGRAFAAGADASEFDAPPVAPHLPEITNRISKSEIPWIAAINGVALGGGCELALACRYRIAAPSAQIGLPEVTLGVVPGAGGTQRLPRLVGLRRALEMITTGKPLSAGQAEAAGLIDGIADDPVAVAERLDEGSLALAARVDEMVAPAFDASVFDEVSTRISAKMPGQIAPHKALDLIELATKLPVAEGMKTEREVFVDLRSGEQARALRHLFFAERSAAKPPELGAPPAPLDQIAVVGGGLMGAGIAYALANAGLPVVVLETDEGAKERAEANLETLVLAALKRGLITEDGAAQRRNLLTVSTDFGDAAKADLAIEAAFEELSVKQSIFAQLQEHLRPDAILATNTSYLDINEIAGALQDRSRLLGLHFFAPAHIMKLLEIVKAEATSDRALATGYALAKRLRKVPVLAGVCDGFIGNRILARYREAADTVLMDGSTPWEIDEAMTEFGYAMGPYEAQDLSGLDIAHANRRRQDATRDPKRRYIPIADRMVELGKLGRKTGAGWYRYPGGGGKVDDPIVADLALEEAHFAGIERTNYEPDEIRERLLLAMINEAADILADGIAQNARDIDLVTVFGYGFPRWRGGLMHYADSLGVRNIVNDLKRLAGEDEVAWQVSPTLIHCAEAGVALKDFRADMIS